LGDGDIFRIAARYGFPPESQKYVDEHPIALDRGNGGFRTWSPIQGQTEYSLSGCSTRKHP
jgi:hypothetical protein